MTYYERSEESNGFLIKRIGIDVSLRSKFILIILQLSRKFLRYIELRIS